MKYTHVIKNSNNKNRTRLSPHEAQFFLLSRTQLQLFFLKGGSFSLVVQVNCIGFFFFFFVILLCGWSFFSTDVLNPFSGKGDLRLII